MFSFLYQHFFKPLAFSQDPEKVHDRMTAMGNLLGKFALTRNLTRQMFAFEDPRLEKIIAGITFKNPIGLAAGFDKNAHLLDILPYVGFGFAEIGSVTAKPSSGNPKPRLWRLPDSQALVVNYGLMNDGVDVVLERVRKSRVVRERERIHGLFGQGKFSSRQTRQNSNTNFGSNSDSGENLLSLAHSAPTTGRELGRQFENGTLPTPAPTHGEGQRRGRFENGNLSSSAPTQKGRLWKEDGILRNFRIGISVAKTNCKETADEAVGIADYFECFQKVNTSGLADYITVNISCPNAYGGEPFTTADKFERLSAKLKEVQWDTPVFVKLPCDYSNDELDVMLGVAMKYGYSGVILSNLTKDRINNPIIHKSDLSKVGKGGISGKPTFEQSNELIRRARGYLNSSHRVGAGRDLPLHDQFAIIGCGGVFSGADAKTKLDAGADLIQMITGMIYEGPQIIGEINKYIAEFE